MHDGSVDSTTGAGAVVAEVAAEVEDNGVGLQVVAGLEAEVGGRSDVRVAETEVFGSVLVAVVSR